MWCILRTSSALAAMLQPVTRSSSRYNGTLSWIQNPAVESLQDYASASFFTSDHLCRNVVKSMQDISERLCIGEDRAMVLLQDSRVKWNPNLLYDLYFDHLQGTEAIVTPASVPITTCALSLAFQCEDQPCTPVDSYYFPCGHPVHLECLREHLWNRLALGVTPEIQKASKAEAVGSRNLVLSSMCPMGDIACVGRDYVPLCPVALPWMNVLDSNVLGDQTERAKNIYFEEIVDKMVLESTDMARCPGYMHTFSLFFFF